MQHARPTQMMLYGLAPVHEALAAARRPLHRLLLREGKPSPPLRALEHRARELRLPVEFVSIQALGNLAQSRNHQGAVLDCGSLPLDDFEEVLASRPALLVALDQVEDPQNLGSIARSALFFGAAGLLVLRRRSAPLSPAASKASAGALERLPIAELPNLAEALRRAADSGMRIVGGAVDGTSVPLDALPAAERNLLVLGAEGEGLRELTRRRCDVLVKIEGGGLDSLNVGVAAGILLHRLRHNPLSQGPD